MSGVSRVFHLFCLCKTDAKFWLCLLNGHPGAFLTESRLLRMSLMGIRWTSLMEWPAWFKCNETGVVMLNCW